MTVKFPHITVKLVGQNGNAFVLIGIVRKALQDNKVSKEDIDAFIDDAMSGDYNHLLQVCMKTVNVK